MQRAPQLVQYQGSKRKLAPQIIPFFPEHIERLVEPFSGMAAITAAVAVEGRADKFWINDLNAPLINVLKTAVEQPVSLYEQYKKIWEEQHEYAKGHVEHFYYVREQYNEGNHDAGITLYLLARCVKGAVRYSSEGKFNQSPDKRRHGTSPERILNSANQLNKLLRGKTTFTAMDYRAMAAEITDGDFIYMDPPYQGVTNTRDHRYYAGVPFAELAEFLEELNGKGNSFVLSYDGNLGTKTYGQDLPANLHCKKILLNAGTSAQATLLGKKETTFEGLYLSQGLY